MYSAENHVRTCGWKKKLTLKVGYCQTHLCLGKLIKTDLIINRTKNSLKTAPGQQNSQGNQKNLSINS